MSMWSANRDRECGENYVNIKAVSDVCSGIKQTPHQFASVLGNGYNNNPSHNAGSITINDNSLSSPVPDDSRTSPYQIW